MGFSFNGLSGAAVTLSGTVDTVEKPNIVTLDLVSGTAADRIDSYTVPEGKYWILKSIQVKRDNAASSYWGILRDGTNYYQGSDATSSTSHNFDAKNIRVDYGDVVKVWCNTAASGGIITNIAYEEYDL